MIALVTLAWAQDYSFPTSQADVGHFYPTAYFDHGGNDWACGTTTYSGHRGNDFGVGGFTGMDAGRALTAAADGVVVATNDGEYDRCTTGDCSGGGGFGNYVMIEHADGKTTVYAHLKQWSVAVQTGQTVQCGDHLGQVGSSGWSTGPHVHFGVRKTDGSYGDPFDGACSAPPSWWINQGTHGGLPAISCSNNPSSCPSPTPLTCGVATTTSNAGTNEVSGYGCSTFAYSGPEVAFELTATVDEPITLDLTGVGADLDLFVLTNATATARAASWAPPTPTSATNPSPSTL